MTASNDPLSPAVTPEDIDALIEIFETSDWDELHLQMGDFEIYLSTDPAARAPVPSAQHVAVVPAPPIPASAGAVAPAPANATVKVAATDGDAPVPDHWEAITAPNLGTFYRAAKPGAAPYVDVGQSIEPDTEVCLIEVMKLFTALRAGMSGTVRRICVADGEMVEHGQVLFYVEPA